MEYFPKPREILKQLTSNNLQHFIEGRSRFGTPPANLTTQSTPHLLSTNSMSPRWKDRPMIRSAITLVSLVALTAQAASAADFSNVRSGLLLGIYATPSHGGMRVSDTIPGYSAHGRLYPGDILMRAAIEDGPVYSLRTHYEMENAKIAIGSGREAGVEIWRPGYGMIYAWVEFTPIYGPAAAYSVSGGQKTQPRSKALFKMESEKPGARHLFQNSSSSGFRSSSRPTPQTGTPRQSPSRSAASLFDR